jgi:hypothetical protein
LTSVLEGGDWSKSSERNSVYVESQKKFQKNLLRAGFSTCYLLHTDLFLGLFDPKDFPPKFLLTFSGLNGVISHKTKLFITTTAMRTLSTTTDYAGS